MNRYLAQRHSLKERCDAYNSAFILLCTEVGTLFSSGPGTLLSTLHEGYHVLLQLENVLGDAYRSVHLKRRFQDCSFLLISLVLNLFVCLVISIGDARAKSSFSRLYF